MAWLMIFIFVFSFGLSISLIMLYDLIIGETESIYFERLKRFINRCIGNIFITIIIIVIYIKKITDVY